MAQDSIIGSLFGITPEAYQQSQQQQELAQAMAYGKLDPYESARAGFFQAGRGLGRAIGGLIGAEDPPLRMIAQQQEILRNIDQTDPKSIAEGVKRASEMGNPRLANALSDLYRKTLESGALTAQRLAAATKEKKLTVPTSIQEAQYIASQRQILERLKALPEETEGRSEAIASIEAQLKVLLKPEKLPSFGAEAERVSRELYAKPYSELTQAEMKAVNKRVDESAKDRAKAGATIIPGVTEVKDLPDLRNKIQASIKPDLDVVRATQQALEQLEISMKKNNFASFNAARVQLARAISGGGDLAIREIQAAGGDPSLIGKFTDAASILFSGTPSIETQKQIKDPLNALKTVATNRANNELQTQRDLAVAAKFKPEHIDKAFKFKELEAVTPTNLSPKDAAKAELERRRAPKK